MPDADQPEVFSLTGATASGVPLDSEGVAYDGEARMPWPYSSPAPHDRGILVVSGSADTTEAGLTLALFDYSTDEPVATIGPSTGDETQAQARFNPNALDGTSRIGLRVVVDDPVSQGNPETNLDAKVILLP
jgi:hypothetical protein